MTIYVSIEGVISTKEFNNVANLEALERELDETYGEGNWSDDEEDLHQPVNEDIYGFLKATDDEVDDD